MFSTLLFCFVQKSRLIILRVQYGSVSDGGKNLALKCFPVVGFSYRVELNLSYKSRNDAKQKETHKDAQEDGELIDPSFKRVPFPTEHFLQSLSVRHCVYG